MLKLKDMIHKDSIETIGMYLDELEQEARLEETQSLNRNDQRKLYQIANNARPLELEDLVPPDVPNLKEVVHKGRNTLPLPGTFRSFEKRFCRPDEIDKQQIFGYNEGVTRKLIGPGFFIAKSTKDTPSWSERGSIVIDYFEIPNGAVDPSWPTIKPNNRGLQFFVYNKTRDYMRCVSKHVSIGAVYQTRGSGASAKDNFMDHYFILCRQD